MDRQLLKLLTEKGALKIARKKSEFFQTKSGRLSPYFVNIGSLTDGESLNEMKKAFARKIKALIASGELENFDFIFGPAYKGIPLAALVCDALYELYGMRKRFIYDRKEEKAYGDKAADKLIVGANYLTPGAKVLLIDDVITTGLAKFDSIEKLKSVCDCKIVGVVIAFDRQERGGDAQKVEADGAADILKKRFKTPLFSIITFSALYNEVKGDLSPDVLAAWEEYLTSYGTKEAKGALE